MPSREASQPPDDQRLDGEAATTAKETERVGAALAGDVAHQRRSRQTRRAPDLTRSATDGLRRVAWRDLEHDGVLTTDTGREHHRARDRHRDVRGGGMTKCRHSMWCGIHIAAAPPWDS